MKVKLLHSEAKSPKKGSLLSAGFDLYSVERGVVIPGAHVVIPTGIAVSIEKGYYGRVAPRSGLAVRYGINIHAGVIDADYRGEVAVALINHGRDSWHYEAGDRIAQLIIEKCWDGELELVTELESSERGAGGFGSTGV
jgi:dUTP pyrophosphatase